MCKLGEISRASYYKWLNRKETTNDKLNQQLADKLEQLHEKHPDMGYRRLNDKLRHDENIIVIDEENIVNKYYEQFDLLFKRYNTITLPYEHLKWTEIKEGDFTEFRRLERLMP